LVKNHFLEEKEIKRADQVFELVFWMQNYLSNEISIPHSLSQIMLIDLKSHYSTSDLKLENLFISHVSSFASPNKNFKFTHIIISKE
jgi:hypothetical protein